MSWQRRKIPDSLYKAFVKFRRSEGSEQVQDRVFNRYVLECMKFLGEDADDTLNQSRLTLKLSRMAIERNEF